MEILDSVEGLKQNVEFIRSKHKAKEILTFTEIYEAVNILHEAFAMSSDPYVKEVADKNIPYLKKRISAAMTKQYEAALGQLVDIGSKSIVIENGCYSGFGDFKVSMIENSLVFLLNTNKGMHHTIRVPVDNGRLNLDKLSEEDQVYITDLIDIGEVIDILNESDVEFLHIVDTAIYKMIDRWDSSRQN